MLGRECHVRNGRHTHLCAACSLRCHLLREVIYYLPVAKISDFLRPSIRLPDPAGVILIQVLGK